MENKPTWKQKLSVFLVKNTPPGMNTDRLIGGYLSGLTMMLCFSFRFFGQYKTAYEELFQWPVGSKKVLRPGAVMLDFSEILGDSLQPFFLYCFLVMAVVLWNYLYYYQESKSIYVMKRLPNPVELHRRAWVLPLLAVAATLVFAFLVLILYFEFYMMFTPEQCIASGQWKNIWR